MTQQLIILGIKLFMYESLVWSREQEHIHQFTNSRARGSVHFPKWGKYIWINSHQKYKGFHFNGKFVFGTLEQYFFFNFYLNRTPVSVRGSLLYQVSQNVCFSPHNEFSHCCVFSGTAITWASSLGHGYYSGTAINLDTVTTRGKSILCLKMPWLLASPGHHQTWYWLCSKFCRQIHISSK